MAITIQHQKEALGESYVRAVVAKAGFNFGKSEFDYGFDGTIKEVITRGSRHYESGVALNFQLKSSCDVEFDGDNLTYDLESKNYNDLVAATTMMPCILVLFVLPRDESLWLCVDDEKLVIQKAAWWCSLEGESPTDNTSTKRIQIPINQVLTPAALIDLMNKVKGGQKL